MLDIGNGSSAPRQMRRTGEDTCGKEAGAGHVEVEMPASTAKLRHSESEAEARSSDEHIYFR